MISNSPVFEGEMNFLGILLQQAMMYSRAKIDALPDDISVDDEFAAIDAASAPAFAIAQTISSLPARTETESRIKATAAAWIEGNYWQDNVYGALNAEHRLAG
ncbi:hypothetical protein EOB59_31945 [Mesorhizobium sp. M7A.F.Ca.MR.176.00.0.0]|uniref:hypothetical protein n=1 Tax=Mesorhizobium sp. M7A.F.Ca.MR.176.00.0.0 TaxID=2496776 RepID=UPI000FD40F54|nr:hypothetical protein [Mesorhizobium sp. M7A.F.Ca.MR.176.00.0.0]RUU85466.1 hypothetical protein EOB59_31945 [Mesorhizobium sp. M7A.F.Ca.MR.176.00.0.0]